MEFGGDDRAVAVQIGAVLLLGFIVISLSMYQATVVPQENEQVEFRHNQRVVGDMQQMRNAILQTAATGTSAPTTVELGTQYPARTVFVNPSPPGGSLATSSLGNVSIRNAVADDPATDKPDYPETDDFWNGETRNYSTNALAYQSSYNRYQNAPTTIYENGILYNRFGDDSGANTVAVTDQSLVSGRRISVVTLSGQLSRGGSGTLSVDPQAVSQSTRTVTVSQDPSRPGNVSIVVPTRLDASAWRSLLDETDQLDGTGNESNDKYVHAVTDAGTNAVELIFEENATYELRLAAVRVGSSGTTTAPAYLTSAEGVDYPYTGQKDPFVVEVRDRYNNPIGTQVEASADRGTVPNGTVEAPGQYRYVYEAPADAGDDTVNVSYLDESRPGFAQSNPEDLQYAVEVQASGGGGGGDGGGGDDGGGGGDDGGNGNGPLSVVEGSGEAKANQGATSGVQFKLSNDGSNSIEITGVSVDSTTESSVKKLHETNGGQGDGQYEAYFDANSDSQNSPQSNDGWYEAGDGNNDEYTIGSGTVSLTSQATLGASERATVYLYQFQNNGGSGKDMAAEDVTVTIEYDSDGTSYSETFTITATDPY
ncbi:hypothetical protein C499_01785 [Halogeometricum borinquense DSM 11551]|uniref:Uncharacterized protein n=1 Tax=Halogeometricum borinquense (strain ATCC 700274 / DSM 11551 / JCM 10706 / KCTC 4070 / PR3) TaxID=469382 RepID=E4NP16_HALBP|nr:hypothetical protein [Halogeometricum borinquense]ADQ66447.1 hypothetical protein Hbor_08510 [Halogeometricum borinquense DSM 11551]ELY31167.1 hypothetical protein C499_01785 [Halogeometricum borinquense DSM 11551]